MSEQRNYTLQTPEQAEQTWKQVAIGVKNLHQKISSLKQDNSSNVAQMFKEFASTQKE